MKSSKKPLKKELDQDLEPQKIAIEEGKRRLTPVKVQIMDEPPAILNFGGGKIPKDTSSIPLEKKGWRRKK